MRHSFPRALSVPKHPLTPPPRTSTPLTRQHNLYSRPTRATSTSTFRHRPFHTSLTRPSQPPSPPTPSRPPPSRHTAFYKTHGRALFKALTLAFFTYQVCYYAWLVLETEETKDQTSREMKSLEGEVRLLDEGRRSHLAPKS